MPEAPPAPSLAPRSRPVLWLAVALPLLLACAPRDLWAPDEPRYGLVGRGILASGDPLVPRIAGRPYAEKPPVVFAAMAALGLVVGDVTAVVARLACALFASAAVLATARLARRWFHDPGLGDTAALLFATTGLVLWNAGRAGLDLPLTACALLALEAGTVLVERRSWGAAAGLGAALGAGLLVKGPHVLYVPVAALVGGAVAARRARALLGLPTLLAVAVMLGVAGAWYAAAVADAGPGPAYNTDLPFGRRVLGQLGTRATGDDEPHAHGPLYLLPLLLGFGLPWTPAWLLGLVRARRPSARPEAERFGLGAATWGLLAPLLALSVPTSKREVYLLPLLPMAAVLAAWALHRAAGPRATTHLVRGVVAVGAGLAVAALAAPAVLGPVAGHLDADDRPALEAVRAPGPTAGLVGAGLAAAAGAVAAARLGRRGGAGAAAGAARVGAVGVGAATLLFATAVLPAVDPWKSFDAAAAAGARARPDADVGIFGFSDLSVAWWFPGRRVEPLGVHAYDRVAQALAADARPVLVLAKAKAWRERRRRAAPADRDALDRAEVLWEGPVGSTAYVLLTNPRT